MRKVLIVIALLALVGLGIWGLTGGFERVTADRIQTALTDNGVPEPIAACMGTRLSERLTIGQLRELENLAERERAAGIPRSTVEMLERVRAVEDRELLETVAATAAICSFTAG